MSSNFTLLNKEEEVPSLSMKTFKEYYLVNGWGWFVDIELNAEQIMMKKKLYYKPPQCVTVPKTIKEYPSIRSMKSIKNLHEISMTSEINDDNDKKHITNNGNIIRHTLGLIAITICYFIVYVK